MHFVGRERNGGWYTGRNRILMCIGKGRIIVCWVILAALYNGNEIEYPHIHGRMEKERMIVS